MKDFLQKMYTDQRLAVLFFLTLSSVFFIGLGKVHLFDWDEINFAESAREMIESGDYMRVQINYTAFWEKPPFFFWLQVLSMQLFGINEFAARFPNALIGFVYLITFYLIGKKHFSPSFGMLWALLFFASLLPHVYFKSGIIDPVFNYLIFLSIYFMIRVVGQDGYLPKLALLSGVFSALSVLTKGPVGFLLLALTFSVYMVLTRFKKFPGLSSFLYFLLGFSIIVTAWLSIELYQNGIEMLIKFIAYQVELFNSGVAGHEQPFYYHFLVVFFGCFPISILALPAFRKRAFETPLNLQVWMLTLFWVVMILFSITTTKIIHYSSMTYIPLAFLAALFLHQRITHPEGLPRWMPRLLLLHGVVLSTVFIGLPIVLKNKDWLIPLINDPFAVDSLRTSNNWTGFEFLIGLFFLTGVIWMYRALTHRQYMKATLLGAINMGGTLLLVLYFVLPKIEQFTQGPAISMYESLKTKDVYVESFGFKSYAQYFYSKKPFTEDPKSMNWLLSDSIDKPVYLVTKSTNIELDARNDFKLIEANGGFKLYRKDPN